MELRNIFKMELYKNRHDKPYITVAAVLAIMLAIVSIYYTAVEKGLISIDAPPFLHLMTVFGIFGTLIFIFLYPFHLLNMDYKNNVMGLIFASGVSRTNYYFVKIGATIISCFIVLAIILFIPALMFLIISPEEFVMMMKALINSFTAADILPFTLALVFSFLANCFILTTSVIITKGRVSGIFLFFGFLFAISNLGVFTFPLLGKLDMLFYNTIISSIILIVAFALIGISVLKSQDL